FFFQAEDGIRDGHVTGVQTCALPISGVCISTDDRAAERRCGCASWSSRIFPTFRCSVVCGNTYPGAGWMARGGGSAGTSSPGAGSADPGGRPGASARDGERQAVLVCATGAAGDRALRPASQEETN